MTDLVVVFEEPDSAVIGEVGVVVQQADGTLLVTDRMQARVRRYDTTGVLIGSAGRYGDGPFEYRDIEGLALDASGRVLVTDPRLRRVTVLAPDLQSDTLYVPIPSPRGPIVSFGDGALLATANRPRETGLSVFDAQMVEQWTRPAPAPGPAHEFPYWGSLATMELAASTDEVFAVYSLQYPIEIRTRDGELSGKVPAPKSFRPPSIVEAGEFTGSGAQARLSEWLRTFDVIAGLAVVADSLLVVTRGQIEQSPAARFSVVESSFDVYHIPSRTLLASDVAIPPGSRLVGDGAVLILLEKEPPNPWTIRILSPVSMGGRE